MIWLGVSAQRHFKRQSETFSEYDQSNVQAGKEYIDLAAQAAQAFKQTS
jgi:hypothetical protein